MKIPKRIQDFISMRKDYIKNNNFSEYHFSDIEKILGKEKSSKLLEIFQEEEKAIIWFYSPSSGLDGKIPSEYIKKSKKSVNELIDNIYSAKLI